MNRDAMTVEEAPSAFVFAAQPLGRLMDVWRSGHIPLLSDLTIRTRFAMLVAMALLVAVTFGAVTQVAEHRIETMLESQDEYRQMNDLAADVYAGSAVLQNLQERYVRERDPGAVEDFQRELEEMRQRLDLIGRLSAGGPMTQALSQATTGTDAIAATFGKVTAQSERLGLSESLGLRARLNASTKAIESELTMWPNAGSLPFAMTKMRLAERDFMLYGLEDALGKHRAAANQFDLALDSSPLPNSTRDDFRKLLDVYTADMRAFSEGSLALKTDVAQLRGGLQSLQPAMQQILLFAREGMLNAISAQEAERRATSRAVALVGLLAAGSFLAACLILARSVTQPIRLIQSAMERLAHGDNSVGIPGIKHKDEIGDMARAVGVFKENAIAMVRLQAEQHSIRAEAEAASRAHMLTLADTFEHEVKQAADMVAGRSMDIRDTAERMAARTDAGKSSSLAVAEAAHLCRETVSAVAEATEELSLSVTDITNNADSAAAIVRHAVIELDRTTLRIQSLSEVAGRIDRVVALITEIAGRTNMLALNATIEAQRAGEAGKGFAVVAGEVKTLAHQTAQSTREIAEQVAAIQGATADTVAAIDGIGTAIRRMDVIAGQVSSAVSRQSEVTRRIHDCVSDVIAGTQVVSEGVVSVTQSAARYCGAAIGVMWAAEDLAAPATTLNREVVSFLATVRH